MLGWIAAAVAVFYFMRKGEKSNQETPGTQGLASGSQAGQTSMGTNAALANEAGAAREPVIGNRVSFGIGGPGMGRTGSNSVGTIAGSIAETSKAPGPSAASALPRLAGPGVNRTNVAAPMVSVASVIPPVARASAPVVGASIGARALPRIAPAPVTAMVPSVSALVSRSNLPVAAPSTPPNFAPSNGPTLGGPGAPRIQSPTSTPSIGIANFGRLVRR